MNKNKANNQGFTLLEVLLAMAVFAIAGVSLLGAAGNNFTHINHLETKMIASWVASNQLVTSSVDQTWPPKNNKKVRKKWQVVNGIGNRK